MAALPEKPQEVVRSLDPRGRVSFYLRMWRDRPGEPMHQHLRLAAEPLFDPLSTSFPIRLSDIRGMLEMFDGNWTFRDLEGSNDTARVTVRRPPDARFRGQRTGAELRGPGRAAERRPPRRLGPSPHIQQVWYDLRPRGVVDLNGRGPLLAGAEEVQRRACRPQPQRETASIEPVHFPYRLDRLARRTRLPRRARRPASTSRPNTERSRWPRRALAISSPTDGGTSHFDASVGRPAPRADRELIQALPERLRKAVVELESDRRDEPPRQLRPGADRPAGRAAPLAVGRAAGAAAGEPPVWRHAAGKRLRRSVAGGGFDGQRLAVAAANWPSTRSTTRIVSLPRSRGRFGSTTAGCCSARGSIGRRRDRFAADGQRGADRARPPRTAAAPHGPPVRRHASTATAGRRWGPSPRYAVNATLTDADLARCARK